MPDNGLVPPVWHHGDVRLTGPRQLEKTVTRVASSTTSMRNATEPFTEDELFDPRTSSTWTTTNAVELVNMDDHRQNATDDHSV